MIFLAKWGKIVKIRKAHINDDIFISELMLQLGYYINTDEVRDKIIQLSNNSSDEIFVAESESHVVGVLSIHILPCLHTNANVGRITSLVINKEYHRKGFATALMKHVEKFAWNQNCFRIEITSGNKRADAHEFYKKIGYQIADSRFIKQKQ